MARTLKRNYLNLIERTNWHSGWKYQLKILKHETTRQEKDCKLNKYHFEKSWTRYQNYQVSTLYVFNKRTPGCDLKRELFNRISLEIRSKILSSSSTRSFLIHWQTHEPQMLTKPKYWPIANWSNRIKWQLDSINSHLWGQLLVQWLKVSLDRQITW